MDKMVSSQPTLETITDDETAVDFYIAETQRLLDQMNSDQADIDRLKEDTNTIKAETQVLKIQIRAMLAKLKAVV